MEVRQRACDSVYVLINGRMIAHINTNHFLNDEEKDELLRMVEKLNEA